ncbi:MAG: adenosylcobinamide-phosphate synthase CbiB [Pseudomonadota bacterium]
MNWPLVMLLAMGIEALIGWPTWLHARIGHPVTWIGALIDRLDRAWNKPELDPGRNRLAGATTAIVVIAVAAATALAVALVLPQNLLGHILAAILAAPFMATRSLNDHVSAVLHPLEAGDLTGARGAVAHIVGRDPNSLDEAGIARASLESLAENASDAVIAPLFWGVILGLPGLAAYKALNTLDSMIGHRTDRHQDFGRFAARLDDLANWIPARLTGLLIALASGRPLPGIRLMRRDAPQHRSPNAGWPEAALAATLGCRLSGPRGYEGRTSHEPWLNATAPDPRPDELRRGLVLYRRTMVLAAATLALLSAG